MPLIQLENLDDPRLDPFRSLAQKSPSVAEQTIVIESEMALQHALSCGLQPDCLLVTPSRYERLKSLVPPQTLIFCTSLDNMRSITGFNIHRGCLAAAQRPTAVHPRDTVHSCGERCLMVMTEHVADTANTGALIRNCCAFDVDHIIIDKRGGDPFSRRAIRTSAGHSFSRPVTVADPFEIVPQLIECGMEPVAATLSNDAVPLPSFTRPDKTLLLVGHEGHGLSRELLELIPHQVTIPMSSMVDSLNVAAATAVLLYAFTMTR